MSVVDVDVAANVPDAPGVLAAFDGAMACFDALDLDGVSDDDLSVLLVGLHEATSKLAARRLAVTSRWDARSVWAGTGARTGAAWLSHQTNLPSGTARGEVWLARALRVMPATTEALTEGEISVDHARALARANTSRTSDHFRRDEQDLVGYARSMRYAHFHRALSYWEMHADPDGAEDDADKILDDRRLHASRTFRDQVALDAILDPIGGTEFLTALHRIERELFDADWTEAKARYGDSVTADRLARTPAQRRADALVEMARRAMTTPEDGKRPRPLVSVFVGYETFAGALLELADGTPITPNTLLRLLTEADIERVVWDSPSRILDISHQRLFTGALRRAIQYRDRQCTHPFCDQPADRCDVDHVIPWSEDGPTTQDNGRLVCPGHHPGRRRPPGNHAGNQPDPDPRPPP